MRTDDFDFSFPSELIAREAAPRGRSRLVVVARPKSPHLGSVAGEPPSRILHWGDVADFGEWLRPGDALVLNDTRVLRARLRGQTPQGGRYEALLLKPVNGAGTPGAVSMAPSEKPRLLWQAMVKPGKRFRLGDAVHFGGNLAAEVVGVNPDGTRELAFDMTSQAFFDALAQHGEVPLPPYIDRDVAPEDAERYQSVFARREGSVAAPTASLHFTEAMLETLRQRGISLITVTLHIGAGTFKPVEAEDVADHVMHAETYELSADHAAALNAVRQAGGRIFAVGTTAARVLETCATGPGDRLEPGQGETRLFITPGYRWKCVDGLLTNFHWPKSTLFMLVSSLLGLDVAKGVYAEAMQRRFRLFSYGDAMLIV